MVPGSVVTDAPLVRFPCGYGAVSPASLNPVKTSQSATVALSCPTCRQDKASHRPHVSVESTQRSGTTLGGLVASLPLQLVESLWVRVCVRHGRVATPFRAAASRFSQNWHIDVFRHDARAGKRCEYSLVANCFGGARAGRKQSEPSELATMLFRRALPFVQN